MQFDGRGRLSARRVALAVAAPIFAGPPVLIRAAVAFTSIAVRWWGGIVLAAVLSGTPVLSRTPVAA
jgi:hypothetical protein